MFTKKKNNGCVTHTTMSTIKPNVIKKQYKKLLTNLNLFEMFNGF